MLHKNPNWKPTKKGETWQGYIRLFGKHDCPYSDKRGRVFKHRYIWWKEYGDSNLIMDKEVLHHKNRDKVDNRIENLEKMNVAKHNKIHFKKRTPEEIKRYRREWAIKNKNKLNKRKREKRQENLFEIRKKEAKYRECRREQENINQKRYRDKNKEIINLRKNIAYHTGIYPISKDLEELKKIKKQIAIRKAKKKKF